MDVHLRDVTEDDIPALARVIALAFEEHRGKLTPPSSSLNKSPESVRQELQTAKAVVACHKNELLGCVFYSPNDDCVYLAHLAVLPDYRGLGVAKTLIQAVQMKALEQGFTNLRLSVRLVLEKTLAFYESLGFTFYSYGSHPGFESPT
jgi:ribosomal protein S18 acetylase RimI-like enzyme